MNFWTDLTLDEYVNLKFCVETHMKITVMTSTGDDDLINLEKQRDLEYRKVQLKRLQEEVVVPTTAELPEDVIFVVKMSTTALMWITKIAFICSICLYQNGMKDYL